MIDHSASSPDDAAAEPPIAWPLRAWMAVEVAFGLAAIGAVFLRPDQTATNFAWPIAATVMAAVLGAFYLASALLFVVPLFQRRWPDVRVMILPTAIFAAMMCLTTFLHWDKFSHGTRPFAVWLASYVLPPPIFGLLYAWHQRRARPVGTDVAAPLPARARSFLRANGLATVAVAAVLFAWPALLVPHGPWPLTPLTLRALCSWLIGVGLLQASMAWENDWRRVRLATAMLLLLPPALFVQLMRFGAEVDWSNAAVWVLLLDTTAAGLVAAWLWSAPRARRADHGA